MNPIDFILHIDEHLVNLVNQYGSWTYGILFAIIFVETGLVLMPLLPGDSLLFAAGALAVSYTHLDVYKRQRSAWARTRHVSLPPKW